MSQPGDQQCLNCLFLTQMDQVGGLCLRYPPVPAGSKWSFPVVSGGFWCGEWQALGTSKIRQATADLRAQTQGLQAAVESAEHLHKLFPFRGFSMATGVQPIDQLVTAVAALDTVIASAEALINGISAQITAAVAAALAGGATAAQLVPLTSLATDLANQTAALSAAITANTPPVPAPTPPAP